MKPSNKLLLPLGEKTVIEHSVDTILQSKVGEVIVVLGYQANAVQKLLQERKVKLVQNTNYQTGMTSSIQMGVNSISRESKGMMIYLSDLVFMEPCELNKLVSEFESRLSQDPKTIVFPSFQGQRGNPVIFSTYYQSSILEHKEPDGCKGIVQQYLGHVLKVPMDTDHVLLDVDTEADYQKAIQQLDTPCRKNFLKS